MATVIRFPGKEPARDLFNPPLVYARRPDDASGDVVPLEISRTTIEKLVQAGLKVPIFQMWAHLVGEWPPINNAFKLNHEAGADGVRTVSDCGAVFSGIKRPCGFDDYGEDVFVYVIETPGTLYYEPSLACLAKVKPSPTGTVLTVHVKQVSESLQPVDPSVWGVITKWEFVGADKEHPQLPSGFNDRYDKQLWP